MPARPSRKAVPLAGAAFATVIVLAGCGDQGRPGAAAVVGGESISNTELQQDLTEVEELYAEFGQPLRDQELVGQAGQILSARINTTLIEEIAQANAISLGGDRIDDAVDDLGGRDALAQQGVVFDFHIDLLAKAAVVGEGLVEQESAADIAAMEESIAEGLREQLGQQGGMLGLEGEDLEEHVEEGVAQQEAAIAAALPEILLEEHLLVRWQEAEIEVNPRYGSLDRNGLQVIPGGSELSSMEAPDTEGLPFPAEEPEGGR